MAADLGTQMLLARVERLLSNSHLALQDGMLMVSRATLDQLAMSLVDIVGEEQSKVTWQRTLRKTRTRTSASRKLKDGDLCTFALVPCFLGDLGLVDANSPAMLAVHERLAARASVASVHVPVPCIDLLGDDDETLQERRVARFALCLSRACCFVGPVGLVRESSQHDWPPPSSLTFK